MEELEEHMFFNLMMILSLEKGTDERGDYYNIFLHELVRKSKKMIFYSREEQKAVYLFQHLYRVLGDVEEGVKFAQEKLAARDYGG